MPTANSEVDQEKLENLREAARCRRGKSDCPYHWPICGLREDTPGSIHPGPPSRACSIAAFYARNRLGKELQRAKTQKQRSLSLIFLDLDHFKRFNDCFLDTMQATGQRAAIHG